MGPNPCYYQSKVVYACKLSGVGSTGMSCEHKDIVIKYLPTEQIYEAVDKTLPVFKCKFC